MAGPPSRYVCLICRNPIPHAGAECPHCKSHSSVAVGATPQILGAMFAVMIALMIGTAAYNRAFDHERLERAQEHYLLGRTLDPVVQFAACSVAVVDPAEIDRLNIYQAGLLAMRRAVEGLDPAPQHLLVDHLFPVVVVGVFGLGFL